jgi:hypothetical protein
MYKKITHGIVEEHFDHPKVLPPALKSSLLTTSTMGELPAIVINEATLTFRMDSRTLWTRYALGMINLSVVTLGNISSSIHQVEAGLFKASSDIGTYFVPYYGATAGYKLGELLSTYARTGVDEINTIKNGSDLTQFRTLWLSPIDNLAEYLNILNPQQYPKDLLVDQFSNLTKYWTDNFLARSKSDDIAGANSLDNIIKIAVSGIPNHTNKGYASIADTLSRGIIAQYPISFI